ncbi:MAG: Flp pilus assembly complex ATPase component TadA [Anaerolineae bacterium]|nr:Flp pilus assembly complex ATPase component TadA [Gloeobacterales cyanobacterium ES-bin-313]
MTIGSGMSRRALVSRKTLFPFGERLVKVGLVTEMQLQQALEENRRTGRSLVDILSQMTHGKIAPEMLRQFKSQQLFELKILFGVQSFDPDNNVVDPVLVAKLIDDLVPLEVCTRYQLVPVRQEANATIVAMVDPEDLEALDDLNRRLRARGLVLQRIVITPEDYQQLLSGYMDNQVGSGAAPAEEAFAQEFDDFIGSLEEVSDNEGEMDLGQLSQAAEDAPIIKLSNKILVRAIEQGASDIHIEPQEDFLRIRFRKDGVLRESFDRLPKQIIPALISRFKIMSELDISERRLPQDGRIRRQYDGRAIDFRVSSLPSRYGEKIVLRLLDNSSTKLGLDKLITDKNTLDTVREMVNRPYGLILVTGPTGSGKTTTLYSALAERNEPGINITTAEDPIEYTLPGITQVQVIREKGMDFARILRAFLRQDPDIMLVGETRDLETAKTSVEAALTGHLVLTTLHTNDAAGAIARLSEMGVEPFMISSSLIGVLAQRLMRKVCQECKIPHTPSPERLRQFGLVSAREDEVVFFKANTITPQQVEERRKNNEPICSTCGGVGYKGRIGVYEVMRLSENLRGLINREASTELIRETAVEEGMSTLLTYSIQLVRQGMTSLEEVERVTLSDTGLETSKRSRVLVCNGCGAQLQPEWLDCPYCTTPRVE